jgi:glycosyltransferase involved in cell wall biosynthesis
MRLLHVISSMDPAGGGPMEGLLQMAKVHNAQPSGEVSIEVVSFDEPDALYLQDMPLRVHGLGRGIMNYGYNPKLVPWLRENVSRFDAVIVNGLWQYHSFGTWRALRNSQIPYFVYTHGMLDPWFRKAYPLKHLKKWLYWPWADYRVLRDAAAVLFTCEEERRLASQSFWLYKAKHTVVKFGAALPPRNADEVREAFLNAFPVLRGKRNLLFLSRIHEKKGCDILIKAFARVADLDPDLRLVMAGPDQTGWQAELQMLAQSLGVAERVIWTGMVRGELKWGAFYASELFVLPSHQENFGIAVAEALGCSLPVLISNKVNIWREIEADAAGLVGEDTLEATEHNLRSWLVFSDEERSAMRARALVCFSERFTAEQMAHSLLETVARTIENQQAER